VTTALQRVIERRLEYVVVEQRSGHGRLERVRVAPTCPAGTRLPIVSGMGVAPGLTASITLTVGDADTAVAMGSGDVPVLATPRLVALVEEASVKALGERLGPEKTSVGYEVQLAHLSPTPVGAEVTADATLESIEGRRLTFRVS